MVVTLTGTLVDGTPRAFHRDSETEDITELNVSFPFKRLLIKEIETQSRLRFCRVDEGCGVPGKSCAGMIFPKRLNP